MEELVILDFETTGLSPSYARIIEVGAVLVRQSKIVKSFSQLMHPGCAIPYFITQITGITNKMVKDMPSPEEIMPKLKEFIGERLILAHNATFDKSFFYAEMENAGVKTANPFLCTMKLARRIILDPPNYKLNTLISHLKVKLPKEHQAHRALHDVVSTFYLWGHLKKRINKNKDRTMDLDFLKKLESMPKSKVELFLDINEK